MLFGGSSLGNQLPLRWPQSLVANGFGEGHGPDRDWPALTMDKD